MAWTAPIEGVLAAFLVGPTGVGKTEVGIDVARAIGAEILNVDSRQIYRRLEIGTAKPTAAERRAARHHLLDLLDPWERSSAGRFAAAFREVLVDLKRRGISGLAVGGAGLYLDACIGRLHPLPRADAAVRARLERIETEEGPGALHRMLSASDPETAARLAPRDLQRIVRALEVIETTGRRLSAFFGDQPLGVCPPETPMVYLSRKRRALYARIEARCRAMIEAGLVEEVGALLESGIRGSDPGMKTLGYSEWVAYHEGHCDRAEATDRFLINSRRYAKRQETWFRNRHPERIEIRIEEGEPASRTAERVLEALGDRRSVT